MTEKFQKKNSLLSFQCKRKHFLVDKTYTLDLFQDSLIVGINLIDPKYILEFNTESRILWKVNETSNTIRAFGIAYEQNIKWFECDHNSLVKLKNQICCRIFFGNISLFYDSLSIIGQGASSKVCQVQRKYDQQKFAAKCVSKKYLHQKKSNERLVQMNFQINEQLRLFQEIQILQNLTHPNFVKLWETYQGENSYYLITDLLEGDTLYRYIKQNQNLTEMQAKIILKQILEALAYLQDHQIVHRDIKLENIMLQRPDDIESLKIIDFGLAIHLNKETKFSICGTPGYIAPEILKADETQDQNQTYTCKSDIFSAGVIFYKLLTKKTLFRGPNTDEILNLNKRCQIDFDDLITAGSISNEAFNLLFALLSEDPSKRPSAKQSLQHPFFNSTNEIQKTKSGTNYFSPFEKKDKISCENLSISHESQVQICPVFKNFLTQKSNKDENLMRWQTRRPPELKHLSTIQQSYLPSFSRESSLTSILSPETQNKTKQQQRINDFILEVSEQNSIHLN